TPSAPPHAIVRDGPKRSARLPANGENAPMSSIAIAVANDHSSRPTPRSSAIGFWKMPKLWRAPMPMVRITAPLITAIQKLRGVADDGEAYATIEDPSL